MPPLPTVITSATFANNQGAAPSDNSIDTATINGDLLRPGTNVVAVEVHQYNATSSDLSFDFSLTGNPLPRLTPQIFGNSLLINWSAQGYLLEQADNVTGPWTPVPSFDVPVTLNPNAARKFYRLRK
jgi:hypothetical protein